jgi:hypothetical protein
VGQGYGSRWIGCKQRSRIAAEYTDEQGVIAARLLSARLAAVDTNNISTEILHRRKTVLTAER